MNIQPLVKRAPLALVAALWLTNPAAAGTPQPPPEISVKHVDAKQAQQLVSEKKVIVLDLRTPKEFNSGHIAGATNIDFLGPDFEERVKALDKTKPYLIHCAVGGRSSHSLPTFKRQQFQSIYHLDGGIQAWEKAGLPVQK
jgi:rhodanese-related sulfurtransferase